MTEEFAGRFAHVCLRDQIDVCKTIDLLGWCRAYSKIATPNSAAARFCIATYQLQQATNWFLNNKAQGDRAKLDTLASAYESLAAVVIHTLVAAERLNVFMEQRLPVHFNTILYQDIAVDLQDVADVCQMIIYRSYNSPNEIRYQRTMHGTIEGRFQNLILKCLRRIPPKARKLALETAIQVLVDVEYHK